MDLQFRETIERDLPVLVQLLANDVPGAKREDISTPLNTDYLEAFHSTEMDSNNELIVVESNSDLAGIRQLTFTPCLTHTGSWRCLIEGIGITDSHRVKGLGTDF